MPSMEKVMDNRTLCFSQGKPCVYLSHDEPQGSEPGAVRPKVIVTEWPNGVVERLRVDTQRVTRTWPDGRVEEIDGDDPSMGHAPILPPRSA